MDLWLDRDYRRETLAWQRDEDAADREQIDDARAERERHADSPVRVPLVVRRP
jgi:hypothetical protein